MTGKEHACGITIGGHAGRGQALRLRKREAGRPANRHQVMQIAEGRREKGANVRARREDERRKLEAAETQVRYAPSPLQP